MSMMWRAILASPYAQGVSAWLDTTADTSDTDTSRSVVGQSLTAAATAAIAAQVRARNSPKEGYADYYTAHSHPDHDAGIAAALDGGGGGGGERGGDESWGDSDAGSHASDGEVERVATLFQQQH